MNVDLTQFIPIVSLEASECPEPLIIARVRDAAIDFMYRSMCWQPELDAQDAQANIATYDIDVPAQSAVAHLLGASYNDLKLFPRTPEQLDRELIGWRTTTGAPRFYTRPTQGSVRFAFVPDTTLMGAFQLRAALMPTRDASGIDEDIYLKHYEHIAAGALARLLYMPRRSWSNPAAAKDYAGRFEMALSTARAVAYAGNSSAELRVSTRPFA